MTDGPLDTLRELTGLEVEEVIGVDAPRARLDELGTELPVADVVDAAGALAQPLSHPGGELANRFE